MTGMMLVLLDSTKRSKNGCSLCLNGGYRPGRTRCPDLTKFNVVPALAQGTCFTECQKHLDSEIKQRIRL
jgi:hypothetical protein